MTKQMKQRAFIAIILAGFIGGIDASIVLTAFNSIAESYPDSHYLVMIIVTYTIGMIFSGPISGKLSDIYGAKATFKTGLIVFTLFSFLCGLAPTLSASVMPLIIFRFFQGIGAGMILPLATSMIFNIYHDSQETINRKISVNMAFATLSLIVGPLLGGLIVTVTSWQWIFLINVPIGIVIYYLISKNYVDIKERSKAKVDWIGSGIFLVAVTSFVIMLEILKDAPSSRIIITLLLITVILTAILLIYESKIKEPIIALKFFKDKSFSIFSFIGLQTGILNAQLILVIIYLQTVLKISPIWIGALIIPMILGIILGTRFIGRHMSKIKYRTIFIYSRLFLIAGFAIYLFWQPTLDPALLLVLITIGLLMSGIGLGLFFPTYNVGMIEGKHGDERGQAGGTAMLMRNLGYAIGTSTMVSVAAIAYAQVNDPVKAFQIALIALIIFTLIGIPVSMLLGSKRNQGEAGPDEAMSIH